jgi:HPt (histidine-containing phosphotransfer) domain-containing protein
MNPNQEDAGQQDFLPSQLMESCDEDGELAIEVLEDFYKSAPRCLARLFDAVSEADVPKARLEAHSLKGSARTIGGLALATVSARLETAAAEGSLFEAPKLLIEIEQRMHRLRSAVAAYISAN